MSHHYILNNPELHHIIIRHVDTLDEMPIYASTAWPTDDEAKARDMAKRIAEMFTEATGDVWTVEGETVEVTTA